MPIIKSNNSNGFVLRLEVDVLSQDLILNRSEVRRKLYLESRWETSWTMDRWLDIDKNASGVGIRVYTSGSTVNTPAYGEILLHESTGYVTHDADGSKNLSVKAYLMATNGTAYHTPQSPISIDSTIALTPIPRSSKITSFENFDINASSIPFALERAVSSFTHKAYLRVLQADGTYGTLKNLENVATSGDFGALTSASQDIIYNLTPNGLSRPMQLVIDTYNGTNYIGRTTANASAIVPKAIAPVIGDMTFYDENAIARGIGAYVQLMSKIKTELTGLTGAKGSTVKSTAIEQNGEAPKSTNPATMSEGIKASGLVPIKGSVWDSRNRLTIMTKNINVLAYQKPAITEFVITRCMSDGTLSPLGNYIKIAIKGSWKSLIVGTEKNNGTIKVLTAPRGGVLSQKATRSVLSIVNETFILPGFLIENEYDIKVELTDIFETSSVTGVVKTGDAPFVIGRKGIGSGKIPNSAYSADFAGVVNSDTDFLIGGLTSVKNGLVTYVEATIESVAGQNYASVLVPYPTGFTSSNCQVFAMARGTLNGRAVVPYQTSNNASGVTITFMSPAGNFSAVATQKINVLFVRII